MFGHYDIPFKITEEEISLSGDKEQEKLIFRSECLGEKVEKILLGNTGKNLINPVEPLMQPQELTPYLLIALERVLVVEPEAT